MPATILNILHVLTHLVVTTLYELGVCCHCLHRREPEALKDEISGPVLTEAALKLEP